MTPFKEKDGIGKAYQLFGEALWKMLYDLDELPMAAKLAMPYNE